MIYLRELNIYIFLSISVLYDLYVYQWVLPTYSLGCSRTSSEVFMMTRGTRGDVQPFVALARGLAEELGWLATWLQNGKFQHVSAATMCGVSVA